MEIEQLHRATSGRKPQSGITQIRRTDALRTCQGVPVVNHRDPAFKSYGSVGKFGRPLSGQAADPAEGYINLMLSQ
jgi:hypothetical protein